jgi:hypothetical protein
MKVREMMEALKECDPDSEVLLVDMEAPKGSLTLTMDFIVDQCEEIGGPDEESVAAIWSSALSSHLNREGK